MTRPRVDVGVVTYNTAELSVTALRHLLDTDQGCDLRLLVRDNASSDGTAGVIAQQVPEAELEAGEENVGFARGVNSLIARSDAPWFLALNSDAWPEPGAIATLVDAAERDPRTAAIGPRVERPDGTLEFTARPFPSSSIAALLATGVARAMPSRRRSALLLEPDWHHDEPRLVDWLVGAALLMRRDAINEIGGFDERFFMYAEDLEWCWRATQAGWRIRFEPSALVRHVGNASGAKNYGRRRSEAVMRNTYRFYREAHGPAATFVYRSLNFLGAGRRWLADRIRGRRGRAEYWATEARAHLAPIDASDRPPGEA